MDKEILRNIFEETSFQEIKLSKETNKYQVKKNTLWINLNQDYAFLIYSSKQKQQIQILKNNYLNKDIQEQIIIFLKENPNFKKIYILGINQKIPEIAKNIEIKTNKIVLYFENAKTYLLDFKTTQ